MKIFIDTLINIAKAILAIIGFIYLAICMVVCFTGMPIFFGISGIYFPISFVILIIIASSFLTAKENNKQNK